eukprot:263727-Pelagomonas_calceolata.AAC.2
MGLRAAAQGGEWVLRCTRQLGCQDRHRTTSHLICMQEARDASSTVFGALDNRFADMDILQHLVLSECRTRCPAGHEAIPHMARGGSITMISSVTAYK